MFCRSTPNIKEGAWKSNEVRAGRAKRNSRGPVCLGPMKKTNGAIEDINIWPGAKDGSGQTVRNAHQCIPELYDWNHICMEQNARHRNIQQNTQENQYNGQIKRGQQMNRALLLTRELNNMQEAARRQELNYKVLLTEVETKPERVETETKQHLSAFMEDDCLSLGSCHFDIDRHQIGDRLTFFDDFTQEDNFFQFYSQQCISGLAQQTVPDPDEIVGLQASQYNEYESYFFT